MMEKIQFFIGKTPENCISVITVIKQNHQHSYLFNNQFIIELVCIVPWSHTRFHDTKIFNM